jgi:hypothetical protein
LTAFSTERTIPPRGHRRQATKKAVRLLRRAKRLKVKIVVVVVGPDKRPVTTIRTVRLKAPR